MVFAPLPVRPPFASAEAQRYEQETMTLSRAAAATLERIEHAYGDDYWQKVDVYPPRATPQGGAAALLFLHGGGWVGGYKETVAFMAPAFVDVGIAFVSVSYRLAPEDKYPAFLVDTLDALAFVRTHARKLGIDADRIYIGGHSAGGHLAAMAALRTDLYNAHGLPAAPLRACFPVSTTFIFRGEHLAGLAGRVLPDASYAAEASPFSHVAPGAPPFLIAWGEHDYERCRLTSAEMVAAMRAKGNAVETMSFPGLDHFDANLAMKDADNPWVRAVISHIAQDGSGARATAATGG